MKAEVKTLIATLTAERNQIDAAILALKAMDGSGETATAKPTASKTRQRRKRLDQAARLALVARSDAGESVADLARAYGITRQSVYNIRHLEKSHNNGNESQAAIQ